VRCISCLGLDHTEKAFSSGGCAACESMPISSLRTRLALAREEDAASPAPPPSALLQPRKKKCHSQRQPESMDVSDRTPATSPRASLSPARSSPVLFEGDQRPPHVAGLVSFGGPSDHDSLSIAASEDEWPGSLDPVTASQPAPSAPATRTNSDAEMLRILTQAVADLELEWAAPAEPPRSRLDGWFLPGTPTGPSS
jgi:hypothetical protein